MRPFGWSVGHIISTRELLLRTGRADVSANGEWQRNALGRHSTPLNRQSFYAGLFVGIRNSRGRAAMCEIYCRAPMTDFATQETRGAWFARSSARLCTGTLVPCTQPRRTIMALASKIILAVAALGTSCILYDMAKADEVPDALSVE